MGERLKVYCETSFWSYLTGRPSEDCLMEDVYETRRRISTRCGNDPSVYIAFMRNEESLSRKAGLSFADYCLNKVTRVDAAHKKSTT